MKKGTFAYAMTGINENDVLRFQPGVRVALPSDAGRQMKRFAAIAASLILTVGTVAAAAAVGLGLGAAKRGPSGVLPAVTVGEEETERETERVPGAETEPETELPHGKPISSGSPEDLETTGNRYNPYAPLARVFSSVEQSFLPEGEERKVTVNLAMGDIYKNGSAIPAPLDHIGLQFPGMKALCPMFYACDLSPDFNDATIIYPRGYNHLKSTYLTPAVEGSSVLINGQAGTYLQKFDLADIDKFNISNNSDPTLHGYREIYTKDPGAYYHMTIELDFSNVPNGTDGYIIFCYGTLVSVPADEIPEDRLILEEGDPDEVVDYWDWYTGLSYYCDEHGVSLSYNGISGAKDQYLDYYPNEVLPVGPWDDSSMKRIVGHYVKSDIWKENYQSFLLDWVRTSSQTENGTDADKEGKNEEIPATEAVGITEEIAESPGDPVSE